MKEGSTLTPRVSKKAELLRTLAARCEQEEPSRELDVAIAQAVWPQLTQYNTYCVGDEEPLFFADPFYKRPCPGFTSSVDAAIAIAPQGCAWCAGCGIDFVPNAIVWGQDIHADTSGITSALALCAAALKARAAIAEQEQSSTKRGEANPPTLSKAGA